MNLWGNKYTATLLLQICIWFGLATVMLIFVPIPFPPEIIPIVMMIICVLVGQSLGNIQKRL